MANLHFHYGVMGASKSASLIVAAHNFIKNEVAVEVIKPARDTLNSDNKVWSRLGIETPARVLQTLTDWAPQSNTKVILVDEVQFFEPSDIDVLVQIADNFEIIVMCYGLMVDSNEQLFPASKRLVEVGAKLNQLESNCQIKGCMRKATHNLRFDADGNVVRDGAQFQVGDTNYKAVCRQHFNRYYKGGKISTSQF